MFTGLVEEIGTVAALDSHDETGGTSLTIKLSPSSTLLENAALGDSIAINGVCLTATALSGPDADQPHFKVGVAPETLRLTNLGSLTAGAPVNLERAVRADTRMGGHFVQGHVDTTAEIVRIAQDGNAVTVRFRPREAERAAVMRYVVHKGFIALDGTSLTVTRVDDVQGWWEVMLVAYTQDKVVMMRKKQGDSVNVEVDVLAKYAEKSMAGYLGAQGAQDLLKPVVERIVQDMVAQATGAHAPS
ncbi:riboflavin synthase-like protein [Xylaria venustula]|nr:riboflavin synthase-like protein [Xylaria venustula]